MSQPPSALAHFRAECYQAFGLRRASVSDLIDAVLTSERGTSFVQLSQSPLFRRKWSSLFDALAEGSLDIPALQRLLVRTLPPPDAAGVPIWAIDGSVWCRPDAHTSAERTYVRAMHRGQPQSRIVAGWEYQWLMAVPETQGSWVLPLSVARRSPTAGTPTDLAIDQVRSVLQAAVPDAPRPVVVLDSHYDLPQLVQAQLAVDWVARLARNRRFFRVPPPYAGRGCPPKHGPVFRLAAPHTHGSPDHQQTWDDAAHGAVTISVWERLHAQATQAVEVTVVQVTVAHLAAGRPAPAPLWLAWHGAQLPADLRQLWWWYQRRFAIEHGFRFLKQQLGWTLPRLRTPQQADRWSWLLALVLWQVWLGRALVVDARLPWERPLPADRLSPGRVRRAMGSVLTQLDDRGPPPKPRGNPGGRPTGQRPRPAPRYPVHRRTPPSTPTAAAKAP